MKTLKAFNSNAPINHKLRCDTNNVTNPSTNLGLHFRVVNSVVRSVHKLDQSFANITIMRKLTFLSKTNDSFVLTINIKDINRMYKSSKFDMQHFAMVGGHANIFI